MEMRWYTEFETELSRVFAQAEEAIARFPAPLDRIGTAYLDKFNAVKEDSTKNYVCYLLPYWLKELTNSSEEACRQLAYANIFVMLYFFIQDDLMDTAHTGQTEWRQQLALGNLFQLEYIKVYLAMFSSDSSFWSYYHQYVTDWADSVTNESERDDFLHQPANVSRKASPVKLASTGLLLLTGQAGRIPAVSGMVDDVLTTLQMNDDWIDWKDDLAQGAYNCLLSLVKAGQGVSPNKVLTEKKVLRAIYLEGAAERYMSLAADRHNKLLCDSPGIPHLVSYHGFLCRQLQSAADRIATRKRLLSRGGFYYWMSAHGSKA